MSALNHAPAKKSHALPQRRRLRARGDFQKVYAEGQRYDGRLMAAFLRPNEGGEHRLGVTASTKAIGKSVDRNRAKRLLRELFRRSQGEIENLRRRYDWVLNAKRSLLAADEELRFREFRRIIEQAGKAERGLAPSPSGRGNKVDAHDFDFNFEILQSSNLAVAATLLPFRTDLL